MVQINVLNGAKAGTEWVVNRFPILLGRGAQSDIQLEEPGVWDCHIELTWKGPDGVHLRRCSEGLVQVNGREVDEAKLRNGDLIELGGARVQFWLSEVTQKSFRWREQLTWVFLAVLILAEVLLIYTIAG